MNVDVTRTHREVSEAQAAQRSLQEMQAANRGNRNAAFRAEIQDARNNARQQWAEAAAAIEAELKAATAGAADPAAALAQRGQEIVQREHLDPAQQSAVEQTEQRLLAPATFTSAAGAPGPSDPLFRAVNRSYSELDKSPELYAQYIKYHDSPGMASNQEWDFLTAVQQHKGDSAWMQKFFSALGSEATARLILSTDRAVDYGQTNHTSSAVAEALTNLVHDGRFTQGDMSNLVRELSTQNSGDANNQLSPLGGAAATLGAILDKIPTSSAGTELKNLFAHSAAALVTQSGPYADVKLPDGAKDAYAALATRALASTPSANQVQELNNLRQQLGDEKFKSVIQAAMRVPNGTGYRNGDPDRVKEFDKVSVLLDSIAHAGAHYSGSTLVPSLLPSKDLAALEMQVFGAASKALGDENVFAKFKNDKTFKDNLAEFFIANRDEILLASQKNERGENSGVIDSDAREQLKSFFQFELLTPPKGETNARLSGSIFQYFADAKQSLGAPDLANRNSQAYRDFINSHDGMTPEAYAQTVGGVMGCILDSAGHAQEGINKDRAEQKAAVEFFTGLAFSMVPGADKYLANGISNEIVKTFVEKGAGYLQDKGLDALKTSINDAMTGDGPDDAKSMFELIDGLRIHIAQQLPLGDAPGGDPQHPRLDLQQQFTQGYRDTSAYTRYEDAAKG